MKITKISNSKICKIDYITIRDLPSDWLIINISNGLSLEIGDDHTINIRSKCNEDIEKDGDNKERSRTNSN